METHGSERFRDGRGFVAAMLLWAGVNEGCRTELSVDDEVCCCGGAEAKCVCDLLTIILTHFVEQESYFRDYQRSGNATLDGECLMP